jgi:transmembrane 9 superfamily member 2/4
MTHSAGAKGVPARLESGHNRHRSCDSHFLFVTFFTVCFGARWPIIVRHDPVGSATVPKPTKKRCWLTGFLSLCWTLSSSSSVSLIIIIIIMLGSLGSTRPMSPVATMLLLLLVACSTHAYVPGIRPHALSAGESVPLKVNAMTSTHTQMPRGYYRLAFCEPPEGIQMASENLGEFLTGNKIQNSAYDIRMLDEVYCRTVCQVQLNKLQTAKMRLHIKNVYHNNWIIDNLPSAALGVGPKGEKQRRYAGGFPIGFMSAEKQLPHIYNHVNINIEYHDNLDGKFSVVGFAVEPLSIKHKYVDSSYTWDGFAPEGRDKPLATCPPKDKKLHVALKGNNIPQPVGVGETIRYTYDVIWSPSEVEWTSRWDIYLNEDHLVPAKVHWYSITNSILVVLFLSLLVVSILVRNLRRDIAAYNAIAVALGEDDDETGGAGDKKEELGDNESGWKLVHADVFRPPQSNAMLYCVFCGSGAQLALTVLFAICFSAVGFLSPARRGSLMIAFLVFYMLCGVVAGYLSSRMYKAFRGRQWQLCTIVTAVLFPGIAFGTFLFFNIILWIKQSSGSAPFLDLIIVAAMWCCVSIPLVFLGAYFGYKEEAMTFPTVTSTIARAIPEPPFLLNPYVGMALTGIIPFAAAYVELFFIMTSLWMDRFYYVFGFTLIVYLILIVTCAEVTVLLVYYQLCAENHRWWWFSFFCSGSTAFYTFAYSIFWFHTLEPSRMLLTYLLYFGYMFLISFAMFLVFGMVGSMSCLWFTRRIFGTVKVD